MTEKEDKAPTPEALACANAVFASSPARDIHKRFALALDAHVEAALNAFRELGAEIEAVRKELERAVAKRDDWTENAAQYFKQREELKAELESLRKPLEGELAEDVRFIRSVLEDVINQLGEVGECGPVGEARDRLQRLEAALRAKGEPQSACGHTSYKCRICSARVELEAKGEPQAQWLTVSDGLPDSDELVLVADGKGERVTVAELEFTDDSEGNGKPYWAGRDGGARSFDVYPNWMYIPGLASSTGKGEPQAAEPPDEYVSHGGFRWLKDKPKAEPPEPRPIVVGQKERVSDPEPAAPAPEPKADRAQGICIPLVADTYVAANPETGERARIVMTLPAQELPRKVEPGTTLTVGATYRITEIAEWDREPEHRVGDVVTCVSGNPDSLAPEWYHWCARNEPRSWFARNDDGATYVTGLELTANPKVEPGDGG